MYSERLRALCQQVRLDDAVINQIMTAPTPFTIRQPQRPAAPSSARRHTSASSSKKGGGATTGGPKPPNTARGGRPTLNFLHRKPDNHATSLLRTTQGKQGQVFIAPYFKKSGEVAGAVNNAVWVYGCVEVKKTDSFEHSFQACRRVIDRILAAAARRENATAHVVFDIVATKTNIANGTPVLLGETVYDYVSDQYAECVATCFVGLTDTTSKRVGRDIYCPCEEFSRRKFPFTDVDNVHMFIVEPKS
eukprot:PhM_4_TR17197/c0_g1_i1/m.105842